MPPHSSSMLGPEEPLSEKLTANRRLEDGFQEKPTSLVEVVNHLPKDVFEKRPFRAYMAALQVRNNVVNISFDNENNKILVISFISIVKPCFSVGNCTDCCLLLRSLPYRKLPWHFDRLVCCRNMCDWNVCNRTRMW